MFTNKGGEPTLVNRLTPATSPAMADDASPSPMSFAPEPETSQSLASPVMDLERRLEQLQNSMEMLGESLDLYLFVGGFQIDSRIQ